MDTKLVEFMKINLGVSINDIKTMGACELKKLYERAMDLEIEKAMDANGEITDESEAAAQIVDYIYVYL